MFRLSLGNTSSAALCLISKPITPQAICKVVMPITTLSSLIGPIFTIHKLRIVRLLHSVITPSPLLQTCTKPNFSSVVNMSAIYHFGGFGNSARDASINPVWTRKRGSLWRGQGMRWNSCGAEYKKLKICGINKRRRVFEKWPSIPTTAKVMPAK